MDRQFLQGMWVEILESLINVKILGVINRNDRDVKLAK